MAFRIHVAVLLGLALAISTQHSRAQGLSAGGGGDQILPGNDPEVHSIVSLDGEFSNRSPGHDQSAFHGINSARFVGTNACVYCHKDGHQRRKYEVAGKEYSIWVESDPHSCSYNTLLKQPSLQIAEKLNLKTPPHKNDLCLNCHSSNVPQELIAWEGTSSPIDGVGCESCHGPAEKWLVPHKLPQWNFVTSAEKESLGFVDTDNIASRTQQCVQCHVGSEGRDVNHDLIAAGHPRLYFEMSAYQSKLPRHWSRAEDLGQNSSAAEAKLWLVGQFVGAAAALDNLERRASNNDRPWPEFSEYACFSCHHDLTVKKATDKANFFGNGPGKPIWGTWHFSMIDSLIKQMPATNLADIGNQLDLLRDEMQQTLPDRQQVKIDSNQLKNKLVALSNALSQSPMHEQQIINVSNELVVEHLAGDQLNWEHLMQKYLAAVALRQAMLDSNYDWLDATGSRNQLLEIRNLLKFVENYDGPKKLDPTQEMEVNRAFFHVFNPQKSRFLP